MLFRSRGWIGVAVPSDDGHGVLVVPDLDDASTVGALWVAYCPRSELVHHVAGRWQVWLEASDESDPLRDNAPFVVHPDRTTAMMMAVAAALEASNG